ncbi:HAD-IIB family hydrolase [Lyngbya sp. CCY1209]|uniref:HAD-IIB family hydrolase n=1 Tax=Lyngbya sp. CCY1209 TaxID=2886103 RepID=UPI002D207375|nr:HAD-IIB family hydrolase [Lyngbya sp. CCY1209]MEB3883344.1 HAD-IIB family hydrolase [Lyngbya sp. CCY1209]
MLLIFTDLDGTLLNSEDYRYDRALPVLEQLKQQQIPVIPVTSKTREEVEVLRGEIGLTDPFIVENGSAIFIPENCDRLTSPETQLRGDYYLMQLGDSYADIRRGLAEVIASLDEPLRGFGDLSVDEIIQRTGLSAEEAKRAKNREFTEPFVTPKTIDPAVLEKTITESGFRVVVGDRFSHLIGGNAGKGRAVEWLVRRYAMIAPGETITTLGLGNSPNDLAMLEAVDIPIIIPGKKGPHPGLSDRRWPVASSPGCQGWAEVVAEICDRLGVEINN